MHKQATRARFLLASAAFGLAAFKQEALAGTTPHHFTVSHSDEEWRKLLTPEQYNVLRRHGTEAPGSSPLESEEHRGTYFCAGCELALFSSKAKYHSGTGWPSFYDHLPEAVQTSKDYDLVVPRVEVHCSRCGGHLGHVFTDGPQPTGLRYCMNGAALTFKAEKT